MRYTTFGRSTGLRVSEYALGTANFGTRGGSAGLDASREIFEAFVAAGGTTFDTSSLYGDGEAEAVLGRLLGTRRDDFVVLTKYGARRGAAAPGTTGNSRKVMFRSLEASLRRLGTDHVDVLMVHLPDQVTPIDEILAGFEDLARAGKILHGGLSNFPAWRVAGAAVKQEARPGGALVGLQTEYSLAERSADRELLPMAEAHGLGVAVYSPLAGGLLTGKYRQGASGRLGTGGDDVERGAQQTRVVDAVLAIAEETGHSATQVSLGWLRRRAARARTAIVPIVGPRTPAHLDEYLRSLDLELDDDHVRRLDEVSAVALGTPHESVAAALSHGFDGDRSVLDAPHAAVA